MQQKFKVVFGILIAITRYKLHLENKLTSYKYDFHYKNVAYHVFGIEVGI